MSSSMVLVSFVSKAVACISDTSAAEPSTSSIVLAAYTVRVKMPLTASSPLYLHLLQNLSLIAISIFFSPLCTLIAICSQFAAPYTTVIGTVKHEQRRTALSPASRPRVILVTGVGMSKGLSIARAFYIEGHTVIGADFEPYGVPVCGRFSTAIKRFCRLVKPMPEHEVESSYINGLIQIIKREKVELWVSCSGVASAMDDARAAEAVEKLTSCKAVQFGAETTETLHEKNSFIQQAHSFGLNVPETIYVTSVDDAMTRLSENRTQGKDEKFIMKSVGLDDSIRADMTTLPRTSLQESKSFLEYLRPSTGRPFVLQRFVRGPEYCTHSLVVRGRVALFAACPSAELLMHYEALPDTSRLSIAMRKYTETYAHRMGKVTGHFSIDFMLDEDDSNPDLIRRLYPIECNPRAHTAVVLFEGESKRMVKAYLGVLDDEGGGLRETLACVTPSTTTGYYWVGHDIVTQLILPMLSILTSRSTISSAVMKWKLFLNHVAYWKDGTYAQWDPWPFWWLYCVYWPGMFCASVLTRSWWSRCNVSTTKMFRC